MRRSALQKISEPAVDPPSVLTNLSQPETNDDEEQVGLFISLQNDVADSLVLQFSDAIACSVKTAKETQAETC